MQQVDSSVTKKKHLGEEAEFQVESHGPATQDYFKQFRARGSKLLEFFLEVGVRLNQNLEILIENIEELKIFSDLEREQT